ncbi:oligosaccharide flippase family protein [archaeon]|jgi:O-antigen/teichoic acid export membrane protein|nr:oligosaccharide flippase family protein [archaeon]MBT6762406.1 oligosaccharide flippase family protein [archaeon]
MIKTTATKVKNFVQKAVSGTTSKHLLKTYFVYVFVALLMVATKVVIARFYGQEELGVYSYFFAIGSFLFLWTSFEFGEALTQLIVKGKHDLKQSFWQSVKLGLLTTIVAIGILYLLNRQFELFANYPFIFWSLILFIVSYSAYYLLYSVLRGDKQFAKSSSYSLVWRTLFVIGILFFALFGLPFWQVLIFLSVCILIAAVSMLPSFLKLWNRVDGAVKSVVSSSELWKLAFALFLVQVGFYSLRTIDIYVLEMLLSFSEVGYYSAYASLTNVIRLLAYVFPVVVLPMAAVSNYKIRKSLSRLLMFVIPFAALVLVGTVIFVPLFYGPEYANGFWLSFALVMSASILLLYSYSSSIFAGENDVSSKYLWVLGIDFLLSIVGNAALNYWLIGSYGIIGAPIATGIVVFVKLLFLLGAIKWFRVSARKAKNSKIIT